MYKTSYCLLMLCICLLMLNSAYAQGILIKKRNTSVVVNGDTITVTPQLTQKPPKTEIDIYLHVQNNNSHAIVLKAKKTEFAISSTAEHGICFAGMCHTPAIYVATGAANLADGQTDSGFSGHYIYLESAHTPVKDLVAYTFYDQNNPSDSAIVYVIYNSIKPTSIVTQTMIDVRMYPNPADKELHIAGLKSTATATVYDMTGKQVLTQSISNNNLNVTQLPMGNYIVRIATDEGLITLKFEKG